MKKLLSLLLILCLLASATAVFAEEEEAALSADELSALEANMQADDPEEAYLAYVRYCGTLISAMSSLGYDLGHTPYTLYNSYKLTSTTNKNNLNFAKKIVIMNDPWSLTSAQRSTSDASWSTIQSLRNAYINYFKYLDLLNLAIQSKPSVPAKYTRVDTLITSSQKSMTSMGSIIKSFYTGSSTDTMAFWGQCEDLYWHNDVILLKAMCYFE